MTDNLAQESEKVKEARIKLKKKLASIESRVLPNEIEKKKQEITRSIHANLSGRVVIPEKMALFDSNKNSAKLSSKVKKVMERLKHEVFGHGGEE